MEFSWNIKKDVYRNSGAACTLRGVQGVGLFDSMEAIAPLNGVVGKRAYYESLGGIAENRN